MIGVLAPIAAAADLSIPAGHRLPVAAVGAGPSWTWPTCPPTARPDWR